MKPSTQLACVVAVALAGIMFAACNRTEDSDGLPEGLRDCRAFNTSYGTVVRCPESHTTLNYSTGKNNSHHVTTAVVESSDSVFVKLPKPDTTLKNIVPFQGVKMLCLPDPVQPEIVNCKQYP
jgi:hypothetical protein